MGESIERNLGKRMKKLVISDDNGESVVENSIKSNNDSEDNVENMTEKKNECLSILMKLTSDIENLYKAEQNLYKSIPSKYKEAVVSAQEKLKVCPWPNQRHALQWLLRREQKKPFGGILADGKGSGKTLSMIFLIITTLADSDEDSAESNNFRGGTLIVCPKSSLSHWKNKVESKCVSNSLSIAVYHGYKRERNPEYLAKNNVVITTYGILLQEHKRKQSDASNTLYKINWKRVILDKAHTIRNYKNRTTEATYELMASKRWAVTGTPIQKTVLDLYSIIKFLKYFERLDDIKKWKKWVKNKRKAKKLGTIIKTLMLRRTKIKEREYIRQEMIQKVKQEVIQVIQKEIAKYTKI
nr:PREDICTED: transcription termination factor 2-like [Linepithema humile]XP_012215912.1 PREDICTED: transcription termination factor 2-like [Linepithema humile]